jgi:hypothetical protein
MDKAIFRFTLCLLAALCLIGLIACGPMGGAGEGDLVIPGFSNGRFTEKES